MSSMSNPVQFANVCNRLSQLDDFGSFSPKDPQYQVPKGISVLPDSSGIRVPNAAEVYTAMEPEDQLLTIAQPKFKGLRKMLQTKVSDHDDIDIVFLVGC